MEWILAVEPWHWLVLGIVLMIAEMFIPTFACLWFGAAAVIIAAITWLLPISILWQVLIWLALSVVFMIAWFKYIKPLSVDRTKAGLGGSVIIGETGMIIIKPQGNQLGRVRFSVPIVGADEWLCRTRDEVVEVGDRVVVVDISGNELIVAPAKRLDEQVLPYR
ncbi:NfeD family protein [Psychrobacter ciconiae]|uniref:NfeD family protein n=1 Tax=Psychrobacter ciconiae TaxID=1553449 RepID=UPI00191A5B48|nr:NfeD family protein [Psychrobacter ciconiae]